MQTCTVIASALMTAVLVAAPFSIVTTPAAASLPVGNAIAVCGCGAVFTPTAETRYFEYDGKRCPATWKPVRRLSPPVPRACRDDLAKDLTKATRLIEAKLAEHRHAH